MENFLIDDGARLHYISNFTILDKPPESSDPIIASFKQKHDKDLMWIKSVFVTSDIQNGNFDGFKKADLDLGAETVVLKPLNWIHDSTYNIGVIAAKEARDIEDGKTELSVISAMWQGTPEARAEADKARALFAEGKLAMSMECLADSVECSECGQEFSRITASEDDPYSHYCDHLKNRHINGTTRWIKNPTFIGGALLPTDEEKPADQTAWVKEVAKLHEGGVCMNPIYTQEQFDAALEAKTSKLQSKVDEYTQKVEDLEGQILAKDAEITAKVESLTNLEAEKASHDQAIEDLTNELNALKDVQVMEARTKELTEAGVEVTDEIKEKLVSMTDETFALIKTVSAQKKPEGAPVTAAQIPASNSKTQVSALETALSFKVGE